MVNRFAPLLVAGSAAIVLLLGLLHVAYTFRGPKLLPRDRELQARMQQVSPVITRETTIWKVWVGVNASHGYGLILFGLVYGYLALAQGEVLFRSLFLLVLGLSLLIAYVSLTRTYFFSIPFWCLLVATLLFSLGLIVSRVRP